MTDKIPPSNIQIEERILATILNNSKSIYDVADKIKSDSFYVEHNQHIYDSIIRLFKDSRSIDIITVANDLEERKLLASVGGHTYIATLIEIGDHSDMIVDYADILMGLAIKRKLISLGYDIIAKGYDESSVGREILEKVENETYNISTLSTADNLKTQKELMLETISELEAKRGAEITGIPSGFKLIDQETSGWQNGEFIVVAGRPGIGKTAFALNCMRNACIDFKHKVLFFSLEMSAIQLQKRLISAETEIAGHKLRTGILDQQDWGRITGGMTRDLVEAKIFVDPTAYMNVVEFKSKCKRAKMRYGIDMIIVDYLQLMTAQGKNMNREQEVSVISRAMKGVAKDLDVPVIALAQLSRAVETRGGTKRPQLSDLRESGSIEQDADIVAFMYRPEYYGVKELEDGKSAKGIAQFIIAKNRNGSLADIPLKWSGRYTKFSDFTKEDEEDLLTDKIDRKIVTYTSSQDIKDADEDEKLPF